MLCEAYSVRLLIWDGCVFLLCEGTQKGLKLKLKTSYFAIFTPQNIRPYTHIGVVVISRAATDMCSITNLIPSEAKEASQDHLLVNDPIRFTSN